MNEVSLVNINRLKPHEHIRPWHALTVLIRIIFSKHFTTPLLIDYRTGTILDGHHRYWSAKKIGLKNIPCYCVDYLNDKNIAVYPRRKDIIVTKKHIIGMAIAGKKFPYKTTRHEYIVPATNSVPLNKLRI